MEYFFIMTYRSALPRVWPSSLNWKEAAVSVAPDNFITSQSWTTPPFLMVVVRCWRE